MANTVKFDILIDTPFKARLRLVLRRLCVIQ